MFILMENTSLGIWQRGSSVDNLHCVEPAYRAFFWNKR